MKKALEVLKNFVITVYILLIIFVTICLLSYNDYKVTVFGKNTLIPIIDADLEPNYTIGDLVIAPKSRLSEVEQGDEIFFYRTASGETAIHFATVTKAERVTDTESTYTVEGDYKFSSSNYIGKVDDAIVIPYVGKILKLLQSKWGFLFLGVFPSLVAFLYTLYNVFAEIKEVKEAEKKAKKKKKKKKTSEKKLEENKDEKIEVNNDSVISEVEINKDINEKKEDKIEETENVDFEENDEKSIFEEITSQNNEEEFNKITTTISIEREDSQEEIKDNAENNEVINSEEIKEETKEETKEEHKKENKEELISEQKKKALIEAKMKSMTEEEKRALIEAKLKSMTPEEKRALIEAKKKKMEAEKNKKGE